MVYKVPPGDIFANNYGRGHMKPSHQVSYDMRLPPNKKIPVKNDQYIQGTPCLFLHCCIKCPSKSTGKNFVTNVYCFYL